MYSNIRWTTRLIIVLLLTVLIAACAGAATPAPVAEEEPAAPAPAEEAAPAEETEVETDYIVALAGYRTGAFQHTGTPLGNGFQDVMKLINLKGGVDGHPIEFLEIETGYETPRGVEAYERGKTEGTMLAFHPFSTGITYAVTPKAFKDKIPAVHTAYGISAAANGEAFPYNFLAAPTYWAGDAVIMNYIAEQEGGEEAMQGKKIGMVYLDIDYGRETLPFHEALMEQWGYELIKYPLEWPGLEQSAVWTTLARRDEPDWVIFRLWGQSTPTALKEAARVGYPMEQIVGTYWSPTQVDIELAGADLAKGVKKIEFVNTGTDIPIIQEILNELHDQGEGYGPTEEVGVDLYNRGVYGGAITVAAIRLAAQEFGHPLTGEQVKWGFEHITPEVLEQEGIAELAPPVTITPQDHQGGGYAQVQQWDGEQYVPITDWMKAYEDIVQELVNQAAQKFQEENPELYK